MNGIARRMEDTKGTEVPPIPKAMQRLLAVLDDVSNLTAALGSRISPILLSDSDRISVNGEPESVKKMSIIESDISRATDMAVGIRAALEDMLERCQV